MAKYASMVKEIVTGTGGGSVTTVGNNVAGFRPISDAFAVGDYMRYFLVAVDGQWETGFGKYTNAATFTREFVLESSNGGAAINLPAGNHTITFGATPDCYRTRGYRLYQDAVNDAPTGADHIVNYNGGTGFSVLWDSEGICTAGTITDLPVPNWVDRIRISANVIIEANGSAGRRELKIAKLNGVSDYLPKDLIRVAGTTGQESLSVVTGSLAVPVDGGRGARIVLFQDSGTIVTITKALVSVEFVE